MGVRGQFLKKRNLCFQTLIIEQKQPLVIIPQHTNCCNLFILCLWLRIIRRSYQGVQSMNFSSQIFFNDINHGYKAALLKKNSLWLLSFYIAFYCYYQKARRTMNTAIVSYLLKHFYSFSAAELNNIESRSFCSGTFIRRQ